MACSFMVQGTGSHVGKSLLVAAFCRLLRDRGVRVAPFKAQNMALNSGVTPEGHEIGRAQILQAQAAGLEPEVDMNPILLKPFRERSAQVIVHGRSVGNLSAREYHDYKTVARRAVQESYERLAARHDLIVIEGAGSPAEINLRDNDLVNMGMAEMADAPVLLAGDIDRGGVFASLVGTLELLEPHERARIVGFLINKFRGDIELLKPGLTMLEERTGKPVLGVLPHLGALDLDNEDGVSLEAGEFKSVAPGDSRLKIVILRFPYLSNHTDFQPLLAAPDMNCGYAMHPEDLRDADLVILPGSKSVIADLDYLNKEGYAEALKGFRARGGAVYGVCGGYQMLGERIDDPDNIEGGGSAMGLGLLPLTTRLEKEKRTCRVTARLAGDTSFFGAGEQTIQGYEIHVGESEKSAANGGGSAGSSLFVFLRQDGDGAEIVDGCVSEDGVVAGSYLHGLFDNEKFVTGFLQSLAARCKKSFNGKIVSRFASQESELDRLARSVAENIELNKILKICGVEGAKAAPISAARS